MNANEAFRRPTRHYLDRAAERALESNVEEFILAWGKRTRDAGIVHITVVRRDLPAEIRRSDEAARALGWVIVASIEGSLITCYRRTDAWRSVQRKGRPRPRRR